MNYQQRQSNEVETAAISAIAVASKTPFRTAFSVTMGIALARFLTFVAVVSVIAVTVLIVNGVVNK